MEFLIWSIEHGAWWRPGGMGYTRRLDEAGRYSSTEAEAIVRRANGPHLKPGEANECAIPIECVEREGPTAAATRRFHFTPQTPHSHVWIDPDEPAIERAPYSPVIGPRRREMKPGRTYHCARCGSTVTLSSTEPNPTRLDIGL